MSGFQSVSGRFTAGPGTASRPAFTFAGDPDTGFFRVAADTLGVSSAGVEIFRFAGGGSEPDFASFRASNGAGVGVGKATYDGNNASNARVSYAQVQGAIGTNTAGAHTGKLIFRTAQAGALTDQMILDGSTLTQNGNVLLTVPGATVNGGNTRSIGALRTGFCYHNLDYIAYHHVFKSGASEVEAGRIDENQNLRLGTSITVAQHTFAKTGGLGASILAIYSPTYSISPIIMYSANLASASSATTVLKVERESVSGRSASFGGVVGTSGSDYAEYMRKALNCGTILKGAICGVNADGDLTDVFAEAHSFVVKSTDPSFVGGDTWGNPDAVGFRPEPPIFQTPEYTGPGEPAALPDDADEAAIAAYNTAFAEFEEAIATYEATVAAAHAAHDQAMAQYETAREAFEAVFEAARARVDRIAFSGQVPVNVTGANVGDYIVPVEAPGGGITGIAVAEDDISFAQYRRAVGRVWNILNDGRAWISVKVA